MKNNHSNFNTILVSIIFLFGIMLLVGLRFDAIWAGGEGFVKQRTASIGSDNFVRGETIIPTTHSLLKLPMGLICIEAGSELTLLSLTAEENIVNLRSGRISTMDTFRVQIRDNEYASSGYTSYVHYSWLGEMEKIDLMNGSSERIDLLEETTNMSSFVAKDSAAADYYTYCETVLNELN
ncbi:MAG: hypothetical protein O3B64_00205 [bacterium]|nr:hypothetical protein [bacterium]MDA1024418.1 hypothetical protein [bacterium]